MIAEQLPTTRKTMAIVARRFNQTFQYRWERIVDFLKLHYILSKREEPFWRSMTDPASIPQSLGDLLELWKYKTPSDADFTSNNEVFPAASYQYVLYGMGFKMNPEYSQRLLRDQARAENEFATNQKIVQQALAKMPSHRNLIDKIHQHGFQTI